MTRPVRLLAAALALAVALTGCGHRVRGGADSRTRPDRPPVTGPGPATGDSTGGTGLTSTELSGVDSTLSGIDNQLSQADQPGDSDK